MSLIPRMPQKKSWKSQAIEITCIVLVTLVFLYYAVSFIGLNGHINYHTTINGGSPERSRAKGIFLAYAEVLPSNGGLDSFRFTAWTNKYLDYRFHGAIFHRVVNLPNRRILNVNPELPWKDDIALCYSWDSSALDLTGSPNARYVDAGSVHRLFVYTCRNDSLIGFMDFLAR